MKNQEFLLAVLYWTVDGTVDGTAGQLGTAGQWTVDRRTVQYGTMGQLGTTGQWTEGLSSMGQRDTGRAILYWIEAARDSGHGGWTVDGTEWTELLSLL